MRVASCEDIFSVMFSNVFASTAGSIRVRIAQQQTPTEQQNSVLGALARAIMNQPYQRYLPNQTDSGANPLYLIYNVKVIEMMLTILL